MPDLRTELEALVGDLQTKADADDPAVLSADDVLEGVRELLKRHPAPEPICGCGFVQTEPPSLIHFRTQRCTVPATVVIPEPAQPTAPSVGYLCNDCGRSRGGPGVPHDCPARKPSAR